MKKYLLIILVFLFFGSVEGQNPSDKLLEFYNILNFSYVDSFNYNELTEVAIIKMLAELDPHSTYIPADKVKSMNESLNGEYEGIGVQFDVYKDTVLIVSVIPGGPSDKMGLISGDRVIKADSHIVSGIGMSDEEIVSTLRGKNGSTVKLEIKRRGKQKLINVSIVRGKIPIYSVDAGYMLNEKTGYIKINRFARNTLGEYKEAFKKLSEENVEDLIIDLRDNGGGYLFSAVELVDEFISGKKIIVTTKGLRQKEHAYKSGSKGTFQEGRLIVLINEGSASASEIFAGAIQDWDRGIIIGRRSYGKGLVMKPYTFSDGSMMRLTTSKYYTPSGRCIQKDYSETKEKYNKEILNRYKKGEFYNQDSIDIPKEILFKTKSGREVYGGGGIVPDIFVPADTLLLSETFQDIIHSSAFIQFSMDYTELNRDDLINLTDVDDLMNDSVFSKKMVLEFEKYLIDKEIIEQPLNVDYHRVIKRQLLAFVARHLWDDRSYHKVINQDQDILNLSLDILISNKFNWEELSYK